LCGSLAALGHGDVLLVVDAGFPIPRDADRIDLSITRDLPDLRTVLRIVHAELWVERVLLATEIAECNPLLDTFVRTEFAEAEIDPQPHADMLGKVARQAKTIVRTGAMDPWGNIGLVCGVDVGAYFSTEGVTVPESYRARYEAAVAGTPPT
jgi:simple sugar transport system permease protein/D-ribose pyranase